jgi:hypothetical protein
MPLDLGIAGQTGGSCSSLMDRPVDVSTLDGAGRLLGCHRSAARRLCQLLVWRRGVVVSGSPFLPPGGPSRKPRVLGREE